MTAKTEVPLWVIAELATSIAFSHVVVGTVCYPGLGRFPQRDLARRQIARPDAMIALELEGGLEAGRALMNRLNLIARAVSPGDAETLMQHPASMTHATCAAEERAANDIGDGLVRLSIGLEDVADIFADLKGASPRSRIPKSA